MAYKKPEQLDHWTVFTKRIFTEWDADPGYYAIQHSGLPREQQMRLAIAWCAYYNLGIAARASELKGAKFWAYLLAWYPTAKRATERRHFRGAAGLKALDNWTKTWPKPESMSTFMCNGKYPNESTYFSVRKRGQMVPQYGDYFYWKWCDLHEVLGFGPVDMRGSEKYSPKVPQQGAHLIHDMDGADMRAWKHTDDSVLTRRYSSTGMTTGEGYPGDVVPLTYSEIAGWGRAHKVPPRTTDQRPFGMQEAETVCCIYKQMSNGSYAYGTRTAKAIRRLRSVPCETSTAMHAALLRLSPYDEDELDARLDSLTEK